MGKYQSRFRDCMTFVSLVMSELGDELGPTVAFPHLSLPTQADSYPLSQCSRRIRYSIIDRSICFLSLSLVMRYGCLICTVFAFPPLGRPRRQARPSVFRLCAFAQQEAAPRHLTFHPCRHWGLYLVCCCRVMSTWVAWLASSPKGRAPSGGERTLRARVLALG